MYVAVLELVTYYLEHSYSIKKTLFIERNI